jgi:hypothetical protein
MSIDAVNQGSPEVTTSRSSVPRSIKIIALAVCGITLLSWPLAGPRRDEIHGWIEEHRNLIGVVLLGAVAIIGSVVKKLAERYERTCELQESGFSDPPQPAPSGRGEHPPAA